MDRIIHRLKTSKRVLVASHINPDGDAVGAILAMAGALRSLGKQTVLFNESRIPEVYRFLPGVERIVKTVKAREVPDTVVILDCADFSRIGTLSESLNDTGALIINIDHHITNTRFGDLQYIDPMACATAEIVYHLIRRMNIGITREMAAAIYTGIFTDTGSFRFANTNRSAFSICLEMVDKGVEPFTVAQHVYGTYSLGRIKLLNLALDSIEIVMGGRLSFMILTRDMLRETGTQAEDIDGMIHYAKRIEDVQVAVLIQEAGSGRQTYLHPVRYQVSLRSDGSVDVAEMATFFGGGGHPRAAGFNADMSLTELKKQIMNWMGRLEPGAVAAC